MQIQTDKRDKIFIGTIVLVHLLFFLLACRYTRIYMGDSFEYIYEALNIKKYLFFYSGNPAMPIVPEYMTQRQPLYPLFLLGVYVFTVNNWLVLVLQHILSVVNIWYARSVLLKLGYEKRYDWLLLLLTVAYPAQFINASTIAPDVLLQTFTLLYFGCFIQWYQRRHLKYAIWMSATLVAGLLVKPVLYPFVLVHVVLVLAIAAHQHIKLQRPMLLAVLPLCAVLLYNFWNFTRTDKFHFTSNQSFNAIYYYYPFLCAQVGADSAGRFLARERREYDAIPEYKDRYDFANEEGVTLLKQHFAPYMAFHIKNSARILIEPGKAEMDLFTGRLTYGRLYSKEQTGFYATLKTKGWSGLGDYLKRNPSMPLVLLVLLFNCLRLIGLCFFLVNKAIAWRLRLFIFILVGYFALAAGPIANTRYFLPVSLIVIGCAAHGYMSKLKKKSQPATR
jgi:4-amino-4-deoxy-L-arabinose transferase-like glycosyltransferase